MKALTLFSFFFLSSFTTMRAQPRIVKEDLPGIPVGLIEFNGLLYFPNYVTNNWDLWTSDGTAAGTRLVKHFSTIFSGTSDLKVWNNRLFFLRGHELWMSDGTTNGTLLLQAFPAQLYLVDLTVAGDKFYFRATSEDGTNELWKSNGTSGGTVKVTDILPLVTANSPNDDPEFTYAGGLLFFWSTTNLEGGELWKSDGSAAGTGLVKDIYPGSQTSQYGFPARIAAFGDKVYFAADNGTTGIDLWTSDGTESGTVLLKNIASGMGSSFPVFMTVVGNTLFFNATDGVYGEELWKTDGTAQGTVMVNDIFPGPQGSYPAVLTAVNGNELYFNASDGVHGGELWKSDGTAAGTFLIKDISPGLAHGEPEEITVINDMIFFIAIEPVTGRELWVTNGAASGTHIVKDIRDGDLSSAPQFLTAVGNNLFFSADDGTHGRTLWVYGTALEEVRGFTLINAVTDTDIAPIRDGDIINLAALPTSKLNIRAETGMVSGSIVFKRNGVAVRIENSPPYAMAGDAPEGNYSIWTPAAGHYELCATPFTGVGGTGVAGATQCIHFTVVNVKFGVTHFTLVNAETNEDIMNFFDEHNGDDQDIVVLDLSGLPHPERINIRANTYPPVVDYVGFGFNGDDYGHDETAPPYALFGDVNGNYKAWQDVLPRTMGGSCAGDGYHHCVVWVSKNGQEFSAFFRFRLKYDDIRVTDFTLVDAVSGTDILNLHEGDVIDLSTLPTDKLNIRANTEPATVGSVVVGERAENSAPYALYGDSNGNYNAWTATPGNYMIEATPYSVPQNTPFDWSRPKGVCGISNSVSFALVQSGANKTKMETNADPVYSGLKVYPNPNEGTFSVAFVMAETADVKVELFDVFGKTVFNEERLSFSGRYDQQIDLRAFSQGLYFLRVYSGEQMSMQKIIVGSDR